MSNFATEMSQKNLDIRDFDYNLPDERIAKHPLAEREKCKLLYRRPGGDIEEHIFAELPGLLPDDAMLIYNNTRVINARMRFAKDTGAAIENTIANTKMTLNNRFISRPPRKNSCGFIIRKRAKQCNSQSGHLWVVMSRSLNFLKKMTKFFGFIILHCGKKATFTQF